VARLALLALCAAAGDVPRELRGGVQDGEPEEAGLVPEPEPVPVNQRRRSSK
jgi:hypothetical protein